MQKMIVALNGLHVSENTLDYAIYLSHEFKMHIVATFLEDILYIPPGEQGEDVQIQAHTLEQVNTLLKRERVLRKELAEHVENKLKRAGVHFNIRKDHLIATQAIIEESYFADLILISSAESFSNNNSEVPSDFIQNLLARSACPVLVVPKIFDPIQKVVFAYDGKPSSAYAIRQFSYIFPILPRQSVEVMMVSDEDNVNHVTNYGLVRELLKRKYTNIEHTVIHKPDSHKAITDFFKSRKEHCMAVLGAYQRSSLSRWLQKSAADDLLAEVNVPVFIAHT